MKKRNILKLTFITAICGLLTLQSCKKDSVDKPDDPQSPIINSYILVNGTKFIGANPKSLTVKLQSGDTVINWVGTGFMDTTLTIFHASNDIKTKSYIVDSLGGSPDPGFVNIGIIWGTNISSLKINFVKGDYEIKKENGKFVSYMKNGEAINGNDHKDRIKNIEFKLIWP